MKLWKILSGWQVIDERQTTTLTAGERVTSSILARNRGDQAAKADDGKNVHDDSNLQIRVAIATFRRGG